jgi:hypothetical protein
MYMVFAGGKRDDSRLAYFGKSDRRFRNYLTGRFGFNLTDNRSEATLGLIMIDQLF